MPSGSQKFAQAAKRNGYRPYYPEPSLLGGLNIWSIPVFEFDKKGKAKKEGSNYNKCISLSKEALEEIKGHTLHKFYNVVKQVKHASPIDNREVDEVSYSPWGSLISGCIFAITSKKDELPPNLPSLPFQQEILYIADQHGRYTPVSGEMHHLRWTLGPREFANVERIDDPIESRKAAFKLAIKGKLVKIDESEEAMSLAEELGFISDTDIWLQEKFNDNLG